MYNIYYRGVTFIYVLLSAAAVYNDVHIFFSNPTKYQPKLSNFKLDKKTDHDLESFF